MTHEPERDEEPVASLHSGRWIEIEGVVNMRDLGGLPTADGGAIAARRLIRSDNLQDLSSAAVDHVVSVLGVRDIIDLRSDTELHVIGDGPLRVVESLVHHHHSLLPERASQAGPRDAATISTAAQEDREPVLDTGLGAPGHRHDGRRDARFWADHYLGYLSKRPDSVSAALEVISRSAGATIVHCAAGKDRTGTVVAMALAVAGVPDEVIIEDYVLSAERITHILERLAGDPIYGEALRSQPIEDQRPRAETMQSILASLADGFGGASGWLRAHGWTTEDLDRLRTRLRVS